VAARRPRGEPEDLRTGVLAQAALFVGHPRQRLHDAALWQALYDHRADVVVAGHDHNYQRFAPQTATGVYDPTRGIREFVAGMGGRSNYVFTAPIANTEAYNTNAYGVLKLTLHPTSYDFEFVPESGKAYNDKGTAVPCR
jgi:hypothetical protein